MCCTLIAAVLRGNTQTLSLRSHVPLDAEVKKQIFAEYATN